MSLWTLLGVIDPAVAQVPPVPGQPQSMMEATEGVALPSMGIHASALLPADRALTVGPVSMLQVRPDVYMMTFGDVNMAVETGTQGTLVVDGAAGDCDAIVTAVKRIAQGPIRYVVDTSADPDHIACTRQLASAGQAFGFTNENGVQGGEAPVIAYQNVLLRVAQGSDPSVAVPSLTFTRSTLSFSLNGQAVQLFGVPAAHSDGDTMVLLRQSNVVVTGDIFDDTRFPVIDGAHGGGIQGEIAALNKLLDELAVSPSPKWQEQYGTLIIPGRGHLCDQADVLVYRDMVTIIRDRVQALIKQGENLSQVLAADPTQGYASRFGSNSGPWTTRDFVEAVYKSLVSQERGRGRG